MQIYTKTTTVRNFQLSLPQGRVLSANKPLIMGIINVTPDSVSSVGRLQSLQAIIDYAGQMVEDGADIIDIGGEPTNPSLHPVVPLDVELERVMPVVEELVKYINIPLSIDTSKPEIMQQTLAAGAAIINDVRALSQDGAMEVVKQYDAAVCLMHMRFPYGMPENETVNFGQTDLLQQIKTFLQERIAACEAIGINRNKIIVDPGIGAGNFGKNTKQNLLLMRNINYFFDLDRPVLIGASRKTFIGDVLDLPVSERLYGSIAAAVIAAVNGAHIIRVHDVKKTVQAVKLARAIIEAENQ